MHLYLYTVIYSVILSLLILLPVHEMTIKDTESYFCNGL